MANKATIYAEILKFDEQADGTILAYGKATDASLDSDEQICDPVWLERAMPEWFKYGNIREQHSSIAAGVATEYELKDGGHFITAHIVDPTSAKKVKSGVLKGFSIGIRRPRVVKDNKALGGRIVDGEIVEVSIVDRPANPSCTLVVAKAVGGVVTQVEEYSEKNSPDQARDDHGRFSSDGGGSSNSGDSGGSVQAANQAEVITTGLQEELDAVLEHGESRYTQGQWEAVTSAKEYVDEAMSSLEVALDPENFDTTMGIDAALAAMYEAESQIGTVARSHGDTERWADLLSYARDAISVLEPHSEVAQLKSNRAGLIKGSPDQPRDERGRFASGDGGSFTAGDRVQVTDTTYGTRQGTVTGSSGNGHSIQFDDGRVGWHNADAITPAKEPTADAKIAVDMANQIIGDTRSAVDDMRSEGLPPRESSVLERVSDNINDADNQIRLGRQDLAASALLDAVRDISRLQDSSRISSSRREGYGEVQANLQSAANNLNIARGKTITTAVNKYAATDINKFDQGAFDTARRALATLIQVEAGEMAEGHDETYSLTQLLGAVHALMCWYEGEEAEGETTEMPEGLEMSDEPTVAKADDVEDGMCKDCGKSKEDCKCAMKADMPCEGCGMSETKCKCAEGGYRATEKSADAELRDTIIEIVKSLLPTTVGEDTTKATESERIEALEAELATVKSLAAPTGPRRFGAVSSISKAEVKKTKAQQLRVKADQTSDKALADGYRQLARDLESSDS